jgi:protein involved in polysaccharide export with SLBB domain
MMRLFVFITAVLVLLAQPCMGQLESKRSENEDDKKSESRSIFERTAEATYLETPIDANKYKAGPGDVLLISILGQVNEFFNTPISPEGKVIIPSVSVVDVKELSLHEAKQKIVTEIRKVYPTVDVSVDLMTLRRFRVQITGMVNKVGAVNVSGVDRVSKGLYDAGGSSASQRNIVLMNQNGSISRVDLIKKKNTGSLKTDPFLSEGDVVFVPDIYIQFHVFGSVNFPSTYEYVSGERISDIIELCGGLSFGVDSLEANIVRFKKDTGRSFENLKINLDRVIGNPSDTMSNLRIYPDDRIFFRQKHLFHPKSNVTIQGEVLRPGDYAIEEGVTRITDIVAQAGGFTPDVAIELISVYRHRDIEGIDAEYERLKKVPYADMNDLEKSYFKAKSRQEQPPVQTDFKKLFDNGKVNERYDVTLKPHDVIVVTKSKKTVTLVGGVIHAGILDFVPDQNYKYYIEKAGGYKAIAKRRDVVVIKAFGQQWDDADEEIMIEDGDVIFVPEKEPIDGWQLFKDILAITGQLAAITSTVILVIYTVYK